LPSSLAVVISNALGFSPRVPVSVCGTDTHMLHRRLFSSQGVNCSDLKSSPPRRFPSTGHYVPVYIPDRHYQSPSSLPPGVPVASTLIGGAGILTRWPSPTPFGLGLGPTNPGRTSLAQETLLFRRKGFSPFLSLLMPAFSLPRATTHLHSCARTPVERSPTAPKDRNPRTPQASVHGLAPLNFRRRTSRPVSYYAFF
jgi:hypothetical protein